jgi:hypothetical protein
VVTRLRAALIASDDGACADAPSVKQRRTPAVINMRLDMHPP